MNNKHLTWIIPLLLLLGYMGGLYWNIPKEMDVTLDLTNNSVKFMELFNDSMEQIPSLNCCYPIECPQSKDNPKSCNCEYLISCFEEEE